MTYVPIEYPKMVPGPDGPTVVQDAGEELAVLTRRVTGLSGGSIRRIEEYKIGAFDVPTAADVVDVKAWLLERKTASHDWIGALYRPYEPPV